MFGPGVDVMHVLYNLRIILAWTIHSCNDNKDSVHFTISLAQERFFMQFRDVNMASFHHSKGMCACGLDFHHRRQVLKTCMHYLSQKSMSLGRLRSLGLGVLAGGTLSLARVMISSLERVFKKT